MTALWAVLAGLALAAGARHLWRTRAGRGRGTPRVDDAALRRILETGTLPGEDDDRLDLDEAARAEREFWDEGWDEPEEYGR